MKVAPRETSYTILTSKTGRRWISYQPSSGIIVELKGKTQ